jgi:cell division protein FtsX
MMLLKEIVKDILCVLGSVICIFLFPILFVCSLTLYTSLSYEVTHGLVFMTIKWGIASVSIIFFIFIVIGLFYTWINDCKHRAEMQKAAERWK